MGLDKVDRLRSGMLLTAKVAVPSLFGCPLRAPCLRGVAGFIAVSTGKGAPGGCCGRVAGRPTYGGPRRRHESRRCHPLCPRCRRRQVPRGQRDHQCATAFPGRKGRRRQSS